MTRAAFKMYDVVDTAGRFAGLRCNALPLDLEAAEELRNSVCQAGKPAVVRTKDRLWEDYVFKQRHGKKRGSKTS